MTWQFAKIVTATLLAAGALSLSALLAAADQLSTAQVLAQAQSQSQAQAVTGLLAKLEKNTQPAVGAPRAVATFETASYELAKIESAPPPAPADRQDRSPEMAKLPVPVAPPLAQPIVEDRSPVKAQTPPPEKNAEEHVEFSVPIAPPLAQPVIVDRPILKAEALPAPQVQKRAGERVELPASSVIDQAAAVPVIPRKPAVPVAESSPAASAPEQPQPHDQAASVKPTDVRYGKPKAPAKHPPMRIVEKRQISGVSVSEIRRIVADHPQIQALARSYGF
jgi:hypothetical protein